MLRTARRMVPGVGLDPPSPLGSWATEDKTHTALADQGFLKPSIIGMARIRPATVPIESSSEVIEEPDFPSHSFKARICAAVGFLQTVRIDAGISLTGHELNDLIYHVRRQLPFFPTGRPHRKQPSEG